MARTSSTVLRFLCTGDDELDEDEDGCVRREADGGGGGGRWDVEEEEAADAAAARVVVSGRFCMAAVPQTFWAEWC